MYFRKKYVFMKKNHVGKVKVLICVLCCFAGVSLSPPPPPLPPPFFRLHAQHNLISKCPVCADTCMCNL